MRWIMLLICLLPVLAMVSNAAGADSHRARRSRLMAALPDGIVLVRGLSATGLNWNFYYLTGIRQPGGALLLAPAGIRIGTGRRYPGRDYIRGRMVKQILFLPGSDPLLVRWGEEGGTTADSAEAGDLGVDAVFRSDELEEILARALFPGGKLHYVRAGEPSLASSTDRDAEFVAKIRHHLFGTEVRDATSVVHEMRRLKEDTEVRQVERAIQATAEALVQVMKSVRPGMTEYQIEAEIDGRCRALGAEERAFETIVASGPNAVRLHYCENTRTLGAGDLVLIDTGTSFGGYKSDISRTFPADGRFTPRQREVYEVVLRGTLEAIARSKPGAFLADIHAAAFDLIAAAGFGKYFIHGTSHHLGLETHDVGDVHKPLGPGAVFTVEPGIYIPEEALGVRIEDDILITSEGSRVLTAAVPKTVEEIEATMARPRAS